MIFVCETISQTTNIEINFFFSSSLTIIIKSISEIIKSRDVTKQNYCFRRDNKIIKMMEFDLRSNFRIYFLWNNTHTHKRIFIISTLLCFPHIPLTRHKKKMFKKSVRGSYSIKPKQKKKLHIGTAEEE